MTSEFADLSRIEFDCSKLLKKIKNTIGSESEPNSHIYSPLPEYKDRYDKVDAHAIFAVSFYFSSKKALDDGDVVLASIGQYYSIFHLSFALVSLNFSYSDSQLEKIHHSKLKGLLSNLSERKIVSGEFLDLYDDLQEVREHFNYLNVQSGGGKFYILRRGYSVHSKCFGDIKFDKLSSSASEVVYNLLDKFYKMLHTIELSLISKTKTDKHRPIIFKSIRRISMYDWYGEDMMENFYPEEVMKEIEHFLGCRDESPDSDYYGLF